MDSGGSSDESNHNTSVVDLTGNWSEDRKSVDRYQDETINVSSFETDSTLGSRSKLQPRE
jgi:hypothetical protein